MRSLGVGVVFVALLLSGCGVSHPHEAHPSALQQATRFVIEYVDHARDHCCEPGLHAFDVYGSISRIDPHWAKFTLRAKNKQGQDIGGVVMVLRRWGSRWTAFAGPGGGPMGCGVPKAVRRELRLTVTPGCR